MLLEQGIAREGRVGFEEVVDGVTSGFHQGFVVYDGGEAEVEGAALLETLDVAGSAQAEVGFGDLETVGGGAHGAYAFLRGVGEVVFGHEDAEGLVGTAAHASAQLVELGETETFGVFDDHHGGVGDVDAHLDDGGGHHDVGEAALEAVHLEGFLLGGEASVDHGGLILRSGEVALHHLETVVEVLEVRLLTLGGGIRSTSVALPLDERVNDIDLAAGVDLLFEEGEDERAVALEAMGGADGVASGRQLVDDGAVEVAVEGHSEGAGDGGGGHHEDVWRDEGLLPELGALFDAEAVLLVDDDESEVAEGDVVLDEGVGADEDVYLAVGELLFEFFLGGGAEGAGEELHIDPHARMREKV